jgi:ABC-type branched-subunit amino acid transport system permease subunit
LLVTSPFGLTLRGIKSASRACNLGYDVGRHHRGVRAVRDHRQHRRRALCLSQPLHQSGRRVLSVSVEAVLMAIVGGSGIILGVPRLGII